MNNLLVATLSLHQVYQELLDYINYCCNLPSHFDAFLIYITEIILLLPQHHQVFMSSAP